MRARSVLAAASLAIALGGCSAKYATGPNGLPSGPADVTYYGPGAGLGGVRIDPAPPPPPVPPPANLATPPAP